MYISRFVDLAKKKSCAWEPPTANCELRLLALLRQRIVVVRDLFTNLNKLCTQNVLNYHERRRPFK